MWCFVSTRGRWKLLWQCSECAATAQQNCSVTPIKSLSDPEREVLLERLGVGVRVMTGSVGKCKVHARGRHLFSGF
jgi:hypothetical protein